MTACFQKEVFYGMGLHTAQVKNPDYRVLAFTWLWVAQLLYKFANAMTKISISLLYLRMFPSPKFRRMIFAFIAFVVAYCNSALFTSIFQCSPIEKAWRKSMDGHCIDIGIVWFVNSAMTLTADTFLIVLPITNMIRLQLPKGQKAALLFVFSLGVFVMACTIVRCVQLGPAISQKDILYYQASSNSWTLLEVDVSIICASLAILRTPFIKLVSRFCSNSTRRNSGGISGGRAHGPSEIIMQDQSFWRKAGQTHARGLQRTVNDETASDEERILSPHDTRMTEF
ncbi:hypothetical protein LTR95_017544, partial [Oleoguttula sp. CCFEE 5521]